ncbi:MAG: serine hydrolase [Rhodothermales bacterium]|nr:serine hydrolase [Rhodothermales bacterium]
MLLLVLGAAGVRAQYFPPTEGEEWESVSPASLSWDSEALAELLAFLDDRNTRAFVVLHRGRIVVEEYFAGAARDDERVWYSAGKSLMAALVGMAQHEGLVSLDSATTDYLGRWTSMPEQDERRITVWHQLTMTTGLDEDVSFGCTLRLCLQKRVEPGQRWVYHNAPYSLLRDVVEQASGEDLTDFTRNRLTSTTGFTGHWQASGFNNFFYSTARSAARFGLLVRSGGDWQGTQVLPDTAFTRAMLVPSQELNPSYGLLWWLNGQASYIPADSPETMQGAISTHAPADALIAAGSQGQFISVAPSLDLIMVRMGRDPGGGLAPLDFHDEIWQRLRMVISSSSSAEAHPSRPQLYMYPNPADGQVMVSGHQPGELELFDVLGRRVLRVASTGAPTTLDISALPAGLYVVVAPGSRGGQVLMVQ